MIPRTSSKSSAISVVLGILGLIALPAAGLTAMLALQAQEGRIATGVPQSSQQERLVLVRRDLGDIIRKSRDTGIGADVLERTRNAYRGMRRAMREGNALQFQSSFDTYEEASNTFWRSADPRLRIVYDVHEAIDIEQEVRNGRQYIEEHRGELSPELARRCAGYLDQTEAFLQEFLQLPDSALKSDKAEKLRDALSETGDLLDAECPFKGDEGGEDE